MLGRSDDKPWEWDIEHITLPPHGFDFEKLRRLERHLLCQALQRTGNNQSRAAKLLNLSRDRLRYRLQKHGFAVGSAARQAVKIDVSTRREPSRLGAEWPYESCTTVAKMKRVRSCFATERLAHRRADEGRHISTGGGGTGMIAMHSDHYLHGQHSAGGIHAGGHILPMVRRKTEAPQTTTCSWTCRLTRGRRPEQKPRRHRIWGFRARLATIESAEEQAFLNQHVSTVSYWLGWAAESRFPGLF